MLMACKCYEEIMPSDEGIDIVIPVVSKDLDILPLCLEGLQKQLKHKVVGKYIVSPDEPQIRQFCEKYGLEFVDEESVLGFAARDIDLVVTLKDGTKRNRSGWLYQQLIKLSGRVGTSRYYLCIDADHVLIHPHVFLSESGKQVFYMSKEENQPYYENIHRLFPQMELDALSYVDHKMLFDRERLEQLRREIEGRSGKTWIEAIIESIDRNVLSGFSEFELYGNYMVNKIRRPWREKELPYSSIADYDTLVERYGRDAWAVTFPEWKKKNKK